MIGRIWHGWTTPEHADAYEALLRNDVLPGIAATATGGYHGAHVLRRDVAGEVEFVTVLWFEAIDDIRALTGEDYEVAYVPPAARRLLARWDERSSHYEMRLSPHDTAPAPSD